MNRKSKFKIFKRESKAQYQYLEGFQSANETASFKCDDVPTFKFALNAS